MIVARAHSLICLLLLIQLHTKECDSFITNTKTKNSLVSGQKIASKTNLFLLKTAQLPEIKPKLTKIILQESSSNADDTVKQQQSEPKKEETVLIGRKLYRLNTSVSSFMNLKLCGSYFQMEEQIEYHKDNNDDLIPGTKTFIIRDKPNEDDDLSKAQEQAASLSSNDGRRRRMVHVGPEIFRFSIEEDNNDENTQEGISIGGSSWDASIAMSLFFASRPELLNENILELGSGIGIGGLLSIISAFQSLSLSDTAQENNNMKSLTLTDKYESLLNQCVTNIQKISNRLKSSNINLGIDCNVQEVDWYDNIPNNLKHEFQTIIAADCAYLYPDVKPLAHTIASLLSPKSVEEGKVFIFGPYQRSALRDLQTILEDRYRMDVTLALMEMEVMDIEPIIILNQQNENNELQLPSFVLPITSKRVQEFLLIEAEHNEMFRTDIVDGDDDFFLPENYNDNDINNERLDLEPEFEKY